MLFLVADLFTEFQTSLYVAIVSGKHVLMVKASGKTLPGVVAGRIVLSLKSLCLDS